MAERSDPMKETGIEDDEELRMTEATDVQIQEQKEDREEMIDAVFSMFDLDQDGRLNWVELRRIERRTGFAGSDDEWEKDYELFHGNSLGIDRAEFASIVNDQTLQQLLSDGAC